VTSTSPSSRGLLSTRMLKRISRAEDMRATGTTNYLKSDATLENAQVMAAHSSPRTTKPYDRDGNDKTVIDEYEKVRI
jgi:hypothetical protein